jgi:hypothetical protein
MKIMIPKVVFSLILISFMTLYSQSFLQYRKSIQLENWIFHKGDVYLADRGNNITDGNGNSIYDVNWQKVTVPHTWNAKDVLTEGNNYYQGIGWYRSTFDIPDNDQNQRYFIRFEGVSLVADVFLNGKYLGNHKGGYSAFCFEITSNLRKGRSNVIAVKVDNSMQPDVAPSGIDLYPLFGGIYRPVTIFSTSNFCISPLDYASSGVYVHFNEVSAKQADLEVESLISFKLPPVLKTSSPELLPPKGKKGQGLFAEYFTNPDFKGKPKHTRVDNKVDFTFDNQGPFDDMESNNFSVIWTGRFIPEKSGLYKFVLISDDGSRLYLGDQRIINHWGDHPTTEKWGEVRLEAGEVRPLKIEYFQHSGGAAIKFGWIFIDESNEPRNAKLKTIVKDEDGKKIVAVQEQITLASSETIKHLQNLKISNPHLWDAKRDPYLYTLQVSIEGLEGNVLDAVEQPLGLRYFEVNRDKGLILNGKPYHLYGVCRHQEWEGFGSALTDKNHQKDIEYILDMGANGVRLAHYQQADKMYSLCDANGLVVWAEIPNTPTYRAEIPAYLQNCKDQLTELIKQNYNHPSILFWGMYNEIPISAADVKTLHETAKQLDSNRLTTQADYTQPIERHFVTDVVAWNWYFGWYYDSFDKYSQWYDNLHKEYPKLKGGLSEYGAGGCITQQMENPERPEPRQGKFFAEQYESLYHEKVWANIKDRNDIWCKFIWNMFDFSWTIARRGDRDFINHKGLVTHDRKVKKDAFYFYKANWSEEPVLHILSKRNNQRTESEVPVAVYTNLDQVELYINGKLISKKMMESEIHKISWDNVKLKSGDNQISVIGYKGDKTFTDACLWTLIK